MGCPSWHIHWMKCVALLAPATSIGPLLLMMPTRWPPMRACTHSVGAPYSGLNSSRSEPSTMRAITSRISTGSRWCGGIRPSRSSAPKCGSNASEFIAACADVPSATGRFDSENPRMTARAMPSACRSFSARYSPRPDTPVCISAPPSSSSVAISPVAAFSKGGPARKARDRPRTMMTMSDRPGMYAPPAVPEPCCTVTTGSPAAECRARLRKSEPPCTKPSTR